MKIAVSDSGSSAKKVTLIGKLDIEGAEEIEQPLSALAGESRDIVVDMVGVDFIASIGIRHLVKASKAVARTASRMVLLAPSPMVTEVLLVSGLGQVLPIVRSDDEALAAFSRANA